MDRSSIQRIVTANFFVGLTLLVVTPTTAQFSQNEMLCSNLVPSQPDERVAGCTAVIEAAATR